MPPENDKNQIKNILLSLPENPGVYRFYDEKEILIYVGKALNIKKRVSSYFNRDKSHSGKISLLIKKINKIDCIVVDNEFDALLLENNLIKQYQPRYNVLLKDDKTYPWICIKNEPFPRVFHTRKFVNDGSQYFGPYASFKMMSALLSLINQTYRLRNCKLNLNEENIRKKKFKVCLQYHIKRCSAPCVALQSKSEYDNTILNIREIIKGNIADVISELKIIMQKHAVSYEFEKAHEIKEKIDILEKYQSKSAIVSPIIKNCEVFTIDDDENTAFVNYLKVVKGAIIQSHTVEVRKKLQEPAEEIIVSVIAEFIANNICSTQEIIVPVKIDIDIPGVTITTPVRGDKKKLLDLSCQNAKNCRREVLKQRELADPERHSVRILEKMKIDLRMNVTPAYIECFDISNIQGKLSVAAMVVFRNAKPSKSEYRHFNIKTVEGPDDYASMIEVTFRRYKRLIEENKPLPALIVVDGGKGQLNSVVKSLKKLNILDNVTVIGIAKRLEEIYFMNDPMPLYLDKKSETLKVIQNIRNEAHRFGISHHRLRRMNELLRSELTDIKGIGEKTAQNLISYFKSVENIKNAPFVEIENITGTSKAVIITDFFNKNK